MMTNYLYGAAILGIMVTMADVINSNIPNDLWYYVDLYLPF